MSQGGVYAFTIDGVGTNPIPMLRATYPEVAERARYRRVGAHRPETLGDRAVSVKTIRWRYVADDYLRRINDPCDLVGVTRWGLESNPKLCGVIPRRNAEERGRANTSRPLPTTPTPPLKGTR